MRCLALFNNENGQLTLIRCPGAGRRLQSAVQRHLRAEPRLRSAASWRAADATAAAGPAARHGRRLAWISAAAISSMGEDQRQHAGELPEGQGFEHDLGLDHRRRHPRHRRDLLFLFGVGIDVYVVAKDTSSPAAAAKAAAAAKWGRQDPVHLRRQRRRRARRRDGERGRDRKNERQTASSRSPTWNITAP